MARRRDTRAPRLVGLLLTLPLAACVTDATPVGPPRVLTGPAPGTVITRSADGTVTRDASMRVSVEPLATLQTDGFHAPLLSPEGSHLAWQARSNADWPMLLAQRGASTAAHASVGVRSPDSSEAREAGTDLLLGRMATREGVLIESPRPDGSRRVGLLPWGETEPRWLPGEGDVRAFASIGPRGEWAYARRAVDGEHLDLVVERPEGRLEFPRREGEHWMMPVVARDGVYACSLRDGVLELAFLPLRSGESLTRSEAEPAMVRQRISIRATPRSAYQSMSVVPPDVAVTPEGLLFFHPELRRMAAWSPRTGQIRLLAEGSLAARPASPTTMLVTLPGCLALQEWPPQPAMAPLRILPGLWLPCGTADGTWVVAAPSDGSCGLGRLRLESGTDVTNP